MKPTALDLWKEAVSAYWPAQKPPAVIELIHVYDLIPYTAPEALVRPARRAWDVYLSEGDTEAGRAAVALVYALQMMKDERRAAG